MFKTKLTHATDSAHQYPLLIKSLLLSGEIYEPSAEIVYSDKMRYDS